MAERQSDTGAEQVECVSGRANRFASGPLVTERGTEPDWRAERIRF